MSALGIIELVPLLVTQLLRIPSISHVRVPSLTYLISSGCLMLGIIMFVKVLLAENTASVPPRKGKTKYQYLQCDDHCSEKHIAKCSW